MISTHWGARITAGKVTMWRDVEDLQRGHGRTPDSRPRFRNSFAIRGPRDNLALLVSSSFVSLFSLHQLLQPRSSNKKWPCYLQSPSQRSQSCCCSSISSGAPRHRLGPFRDRPLPDIRPLVLSGTNSKQTGRSTFTPFTNNMGPWFALRPTRSPSRHGRR